MAMTSHHAFRLVKKTKGACRSLKMRELILERGEGA